MNEQNNSGMCCGQENVGKCCGGKWKMHGMHKSGGLYCVAFLGALVYYIQTATTFWMGCLGVLKALVWPAMLIYKAFTILGM